MAWFSLGEMLGRRWQTSFGVNHLLKQLAPCSRGYVLRNRSHFVNSVENADNIARLSRDRPAPFSNPPCSLTALIHWSKNSRLVLSRSVSCPLVSSTKEFPVFSRMMSRYLCTTPIQKLLFFARCLPLWAYCSMGFFLEFPAVFFAFAIESRSRF
jgi:hypothetical protein